MHKLVNERNLPKFPITDFLGAISVGVIQEVPLLDLNYEEDSRAKVDMNVVMTGTGKFVEVQGTGEEAPFSRKELEELLALGENGVYRMIEAQKEALGPIAKQIGSAVHASQ